tara:strand:- start:562 stop:768 length:207 start_codon:yes stop_codon:yes gene_type:complete
MEDTPNTVTIEDKEYNIDDLSYQQKTMINHISDLEREVSNAQFILDRHRVAKDAFVNMLIESTKETTE